MIGLYYQKTNNYLGQTFYTYHAALNYRAGLGMLEKEA